MILSAGLRTALRRFRWYGLGAVFVLGVIGCDSTIKTQKPVFIAPQNFVPYAVQLKQAQIVSADMLYTVYSQHLIVGALPDQRFLGKLLHVTGVFNGVNRNLSGKTYLELRTHSDSAFAYAEMAAGDPLVVALPAAGTKLRLLCRGAGAVAGSPMLTECRSE
ncbi:hypothetical protein [Granulicella arctica]|uniref:Uncharacterized protein n=1 Tax=Granulicella arctica TaxID=940613 RepID=A0A7Y9PF61_9BACT|nr:hypothetical protein [Granulicella arctica]NYF78754.1 hypothetical protein [Granulicella arctica]